MPVSATFGPSDFGVDDFDVSSVLDVRARQHPERVMMRIGGVPITFAEMRERSVAAGNLLHARGVRPGDTVALFSDTCPEWVYFWLGAACIGAVSATVNAANKGDFLVHALRLARARAIVTDGLHLARVQAVADRVSTLSTTVVLDGPLSDELARASTAGPAVTAVDEGDAGVLFYTSGTTGPSKAVATSWRYLFRIAATAAMAWEFASGETLWTAMPLFHVSAASTVLVPLLVGGTTVLATKFHPAEVLDDVRSCNAVGLVGAGAMVSMLWNQPHDPRDAESSLRFISAAPVPVDLYRRIEDRYGCRIVTMYGLTEAFPIAVKAFADEGTPGTAGHVNPAFDVRTVDVDGRDVGFGELGEIICRATQDDVMSVGYVIADGASDIREVAHPEWFHTGDLGRLTGDGLLTFVDRVKDCLRRRGENVSSAEIEATVLQYPSVVEAAAVGVASDLGEQDILVLVRLVPEADLDHVDLLDFCSARMPYFCVPRYVEVVQEFPRTALGRIRKDVLRDRGLGADSWDREAFGYKLVR